MTQNGQFKTGLAGAGAARGEEVSKGAKDEVSKGAKDNMPTGFRKFKPTAPPNYKSPTPVRVPLPPTSNKGS